MSDIIKNFDDKLRLEKSWNEIFKTNNPFSYPFQNSIESISVFYPTNGYYLSEDQFQAISLTAKEFNEEAFAISIIEYEGDCFKKDDHWICNNIHYEDYIDMPINLENTIYSLNANWGLIISHEDHAIIGGSKAFIEKLKNNYPGTSEDITILKSEWIDNKNNEWLDEILPKVDK